MPRLGEDPNVATAYPNRLNTNLRGSWMRQFINTLLGSLLIVFLFNKLIKTDYKDATKKGMTDKGMEDKINEIIPRTKREKIRDAALAKMTDSQKMQALQYEVGNLTNSVAEIQQVLVEKTGATLQYTLPSLTNPDDEAKADSVQDGGNGGEGGDGGDGGDGHGDGSSPGVAAVVVEEAGAVGEGGGGLRGAENVDAPVTAPSADVPAGVSAKEGEGGDARRLLLSGEERGEGGLSAGRRFSAPPPGEGQWRKRRQQQQEEKQKRRRQRQRRHVRGSLEEEEGEARESVPVAAAAASA